MSATHTQGFVAVCLAPLLWAVGGPAAAACTGGPDLFVCLNRADYLAQLQALTTDTFVEGFESDAVWGGARTVSPTSVNTLPSVTSKGIVWTTNYPLTNGISTSTGAARSGTWGVYDPKHGLATGTPTQCDIDNPPEPCLYHDGVTGTLLDGEPGLLGAGGYFSGFAGASIAIVLDDGAQIELAKLAGTGHQFMGVVSTSSFRKFQFRELEGKIGQALYIFADDFTFGAAGGPVTPAAVDQLGVWRPIAHSFYLDANGNDQWDGTASGDVVVPFGVSTDLPLSGDWNGDGIDEIGVWRPTTGSFYLDANGNDLWDGAAGGDVIVPFGVSTDLPLSGDWDGDGIDDIGVWRPSTGYFYLDLNGNQTWDPGTDLSAPFGLSTDLPLAGDWDADGIDDIGVWRPASGQFFLDLNGNHGWDVGIDLSASFGMSTDIPLSGDWNGDGLDEIGVWRPSTRVFYLDADGSFSWTKGLDVESAPFGLADDLPVTGRW